MLKAGMLHNTATGRYHPISFYWAPTASEEPGDAVGRYRSKNHHTAGFESLEEAMTFIKGQEWQWMGLQWTWDGEGVPAMVTHLPRP